MGRHVPGTPTIVVVTAEDLARMVAEAFALDPATLATLKGILYK
jgi:hypothetical protein